jgi:predicted enzyme related to lactoylglutathione lyase
MDYRLVETGGAAGINGGIMKPKAGPWPGKLAFYIDVDDIDEFNHRIRAGTRTLETTVLSFQLPRAYQS